MEDIFLVIIITLQHLLQVPSSLIFKVPSLAMELNQFLEKIPVETLRQQLIALICESGKVNTLFIVNLKKKQKDLIPTQPNAASEHPLAASKPLPLTTSEQIPDFKEGQASSKHSQLPSKVSADKMINVEKEEVLDWKWKKRGGMKKVGQDTLRQWFQCSEHDGHKCRALMIQDFDVKTRATKRMAISGIHNHQPPRSLPLTEEARKKLHQEIASGAPVSSLHRKWILELEETGQSITTQNCPTRRQMYSRRNYEIMKKFPTKDAMLNIKLMYLKMKKEIMLEPLRIVLVPEEAIPILENPGIEIFLDATFQLVELNLKVI